MGKHFVSVSAATVLAAGAVAWAAEEGMRFGYRFDEGAKGRYRVRFSQEMDFGGFVASQIMDMEVTVACTKVGEGSYAMEMTFDKVEASRVMSGDMQADPVGEKLVGHAVTFQLDPHGKVTAIQPAGYFEAWHQLEDAISPLVENWYSYMPDTAVVKGGQWKREKETEKKSTGLEVTTNEVFTFKDVRKEKGRECALIEAKVDNVLGGTMTGPRGSLAVKGTEQGKFEVYFDAATATVVKLKGSMDVEMDLTPQGGGDVLHSTVGFEIERELL